MRRSPQSVLLPVVLLLLPLAASAQVHPNIEKGFSADKMYEFHDIDHVNLFNGNLSLTVPIGGSTPVSDHLAVSMTLVYNSKIWDANTKTDTSSPEIDRTLKTPTARSNAGLGWLLSFGRLYQGNTSNTASDHNDDDIVSDFAAIHYESADGSDHKFWDTIHNGETPDSTHQFTRDGSYIRLTGPADLNLRLVETPDGLVREFSSYMEVSSGATRRRWRITKIRDPFGNHIDFDYSTLRQWTITDQYQRVTTVHFKDVIADDSMVYHDLPGYATAVDYVDIPKTGSGTARYVFAYTNMWVRTGYCGEEVSSAYHYADTNHYRVPMLTLVTLPDDSAFAFSYGTGTSTSVVTPDDSNNCAGGSLTSADLPTKGRISWTYDKYLMPVNGCQEDPVANSAGVASRTLHDEKTAPATDGTWNYVQTLTEESDAGWTCGSDRKRVYNYAPAEESITAVTDPEQNKSVYHFSVWPDFTTVGNPRPDGASYYEYGLPFSHKVSAGDRLISTETYQGTALKRQTYVKYEIDPHVAPTQDLNRRLQGSRTLFLDDGSSYVDVAYSDFDGVGHYRTTTTSGNFGSDHSRIVTTDYNKPSTAVGSGIYSTGSYPGSFTRPSGSSWLINLYDRTTTQENSVSAVQDLCFNATTGFLNGTRTYASESTRQSQDLIAVFGSQTTPANGVLGAVTSETYYGGEFTPLTTTAPTLCGAVAATPGSIGYDIRHSYDRGVRVSSEYFAAGASVGFKLLDVTLDPSTSLVLHSSDTAGVDTSYTYDSSRRVKTTNTGNDATINYDYANATGTTPAIVTISQASGSGSGTAKAAFQFDGFGRLVLQSRTLPSTTVGVTRWSRQKSVFDNLGRKQKVSEYEESDSPSHFTVFSDFDVFGHAGKVQTPDSSATPSTVKFYGAREVDRTAYIHTTAGADTAALTREYYDIHGRLVVVQEPNNNLVGTYAYDVGNRLYTASIVGESVTQLRTFNYDNRGFLLSETHPELGTEGTIYSMYDARGHAHHKRSGPLNSIYDLGLGYDSSERLTAISDLNGTRELKRFVFAAGNDVNVTPQSNEKGKLSQAVRTNHLPSGDVVVTETYKYQNPTGRPSSRKTDVTSGSTTLQSYQQPFSYDDLGEITAPGYPTCASAVPCGTGIPAGAAFTYKDGSLTAIPGFASSITYTGNMLAQVTHQHGDTDTYAQDTTNGLPRPSSITFAGISCAAPGAPAITAAASVPANSTNNQASVPADNTLQYAWSITGGMITSSTASNSIVYTAGASGTVVLSVTAANQCGTGAAGSRNVPIQGTLSPPLNFSATTQSNSNVVTLVWSQGPSGPTSYRIERKDCYNCMWNVIGPNPTSATSYNDTFSAGSVLAAHLYHVIAVASGSSDSAPSAADYAVTATTLFAENIVAATPTVPATPIRGSHVQELRKAIDALRGLGNLPAYWTDYSPPTGAVPASDQTDMRTAVDQAVFNLLTYHLTFTGPTPAHSGGIYADQMNQLRAAVK
jgi:PKD domain-containing protein